MSLKSQIDITVSPATRLEKPIVRQLMELYQHDFSEFEDRDLDEQGYFGYAYLDSYWIEADRHPFLIRASSKLAGFVFVNSYTYIPGSEYSIAEFFILRKYRRQGIGRAVAIQIFDRFPGKWEIHQIHTNSVARTFWRKTIADYTAGKFSEIGMFDTNEPWQGTVQCFSNATFAKSGLR
ncbi:MAG: GNAT family N-acetyltransferase [Synechococcales bacterium]|nr:GNAT family N-acetyltransferase [Synechococcales bacterium]